MIFLGFLRDLRGNGGNDIGREVCLRYPLLVSAKQYKEGHFLGIRGCDNVSPTTRRDWTQTLDQDLLLNFLFTSLPGSSLLQRKGF